MKAIVIDDDKLIHTLLKKYAEKSKMVNIISFYDNATDALNDPNLYDVDVIFLDIEMPDLTGIDFIKTTDKLPPVIIISAKEQYAVEAFDLDVIDYLLKPIEYQRFLKALNRVKERSEKVSAKEDSIFIKESSSVLLHLKYDDIFWIEALENYVTINTEDQKHTILFTMKALEKQLPDKIFARIHRSYIVNINKINSIEDNYVIIKHKGKTKSLPIAKSYKDALLSKLKIISK